MRCTIFEILGVTTASLLRLKRAAMGKITPSHFIVMMAARTGQLLGYNADNFYFLVTGPLNQTQKALYFFSKMQMSRRRERRSRSREVVSSGPRPRHKSLSRMKPFSQPTKKSRNGCPLALQLVIRR
jgi:hypothetical protein